MAQYRCSVQKAVSRAKGQSAVAKAAYNARTQLDNERYDEKTANYGRQGPDEVLLSGIFFDPKTNAPLWIQDRNALWNAAAAAEKRKDAREAQEIIVNLPHELTQQQREFMLKDFVRDHITRGTGRIADVNIHKAPEHGDDRNIHAHILMTLREIGPSGFGERLPEMTPEQIVHLKEKWAERGAKELRKAGFEIEADRWAVGHLQKPEQRRLAIERGDLEHAEALEGPATNHLGPAASAMEREGIATDRGSIKRESLAAAQETAKLKAELAALDRFIAEVEGAGPDWKYEVAEIDRLAAQHNQPKQLSDWQRELAEIDALIAERTGQVPEQARGIRDGNWASQRETSPVYHFEDAARSTVRERPAQAPASPDTRPNTWMAQTGGVDALTPDLLDSAQRSYEKWSGNKTRYSFANYVSYAQREDQKRRESGQPQERSDGDPSQKRDRQQLKGTAAEIWAAYNIRKHEQQWTEKLKDGSEIERTRTINLRAARDPYHFAQALAAKGISLARATKEDAPAYKPGEFVAVDKHGNAYHLTERVTGRPPREVQQFLAKAEWKGIRGVNAEKERAPGLIQAKPENLRGTAAEIWTAHEGSKTAAQFVERLRERGLLVARVAEGDLKPETNPAYHVQRHAVTKAAQGVYVVVNQRGVVYELTHHTTGRSSVGAQAFMASLDTRKFVSVAATRGFQLLTSQQQRSAQATGRNDKFIAWGKSSGRIQVGKTGRAADIIKAAPAKAIHGTTRTLGKALESLFSALVPDAPKTPEQIAHLEHKAEQNETAWGKYVYNTDHERAVASQQEHARNRQRDSEDWRKDRERDGRDR